MDGRNRASFKKGMNEINKYLMSNESEQQIDQIVEEDGDDDLIIKDEAWDYHENEEQGIFIIEEGKCKIVHILDSL